MDDLTILYSKSYHQFLGFHAAFVADEALQAVRKGAPDAFKRCESILEEAIHLARDLADDAQRCECQPSDLPRLDAKFAAATARFNAFGPAMDDLWSEALPGKPQP